MRVISGTLKQSNAMSRAYNLNGGRPQKLTTEQRKYVRDNLFKKSLRVLGKELGVNHVTVYNSLKYKTSGVK